MKQNSEKVKLLINAYYPPQTLRNCVETEGGICESVKITNDAKDTGKINAHSINNDGPSFSDNITWDEN